MYVVGDDVVVAVAVEIHWFIVPCAIYDKK